MDNRTIEEIRNNEIKLIEELKIKDNVINELEKWLVNEIKFQKLVERDFGFRKTLCKLNELRGK